MPARFQVVIDARDPGAYGPYIACGNSRDCLPKEHP